MDKEIWAPLPAYDNYEISTHGRILNIKTEKVFSGRNNAYGYKTVGLSVNQIVGETGISKGIVASVISGIAWKKH